MILLHIDFKYKKMLKFNEAHTNTDFLLNYEIKVGVYLRNLRIIYVVIQVALVVYCKTVMIRG